MGGEACGFSVQASELATGSLAGTSTRTESSGCGQILPALAKRSRDLGWGCRWNTVPGVLREDAAWVRSESVATSEEWRWPPWLQVCRRGTGAESR